MVAQRLRAIDHDDLGVLAERPAEPEAEVHRHADDERDVGVRERRAARTAEEQLVVRGHAAARQAVEEDGDPPLAHEPLQRALAVTPVEVRAGHDHRALGVAQQRDRAVEAVGRRGLGRRVRKRRRRLLLLGLHEDDVEREVEERRARVRGDRRGQRFGDEARDVRGRLRRLGELRQRAHERDVIDLLQRALAPAHRGRAAAEHDERRVVLERGAHRAHAVGDARAGRERGDARLTGDLRPALGGERGRLFVAGVDEVDALLAAAVVEREQMPAGQREQLRHAVVAQAPRDQAAAVELGGGFGLGAHGLDPTPASAMTTQRFRVCVAPLRGREWYDVPTSLPPSDGPARKEADRSPLNRPPNGTRMTSGRPTPGRSISRATSGPC